ncbi:MAG: hypothetical protein IPK19_41075 [Chloroflexi bacterium]|nr:hypothetical protein [Chloroflexota bacterium]
MEPNSAESADELLSALAERHSFVFSGDERQMHSKVRDTLHEHLMGMLPSEWLKRFVEETFRFTRERIELFQTQNESKLSNLANDPIWQQLVLDVVAISPWVTTISVEAKSHIIHDLAIQAYWYAPDLLNEIIALLHIFQNSVVLDAKLYELWNEAKSYRYRMYSQELKRARVWRHLWENRASLKVSTSSLYIINIVFAGILNFDDRHEEANSIYDHCLETFIGENPDLMRDLASSTVLQSF